MTELIERSDRRGELIDSLEERKWSHTRGRGKPGYHSELSALELHTLRITFFPLVAMTSRKIPKPSFRNYYREWLGELLNESDSLTSIRLNLATDTAVVSASPPNDNSSPDRIYVYPSIVVLSTIRASISYYFLWLFVSRPAVKRKKRKK